jgi:hypothetical protein
MAKRYKIDSKDVVIIFNKVRYDSKPNHRRSKTSTPTRRKPKNPEALEESKQVAQCCSKFCCNNFELSNSKEFTIENSPKAKKCNRDDLLIF